MSGERSEDGDARLAFALRECFTIASTTRGVSEPTIPMATDQTCAVAGAGDAYPRTLIVSSLPGGRCPWRPATKTPRCLALGCRRIRVRSISASGKPKPCDVSWRRGARLTSIQPPFHGLEGRRSRARRERSRCASPLRPVAEPRRATARACTHAAYTKSPAPSRPYMTSAGMRDHRAAGLSRRRSRVRVPSLPLVKNACNRG
jgi:hypothetical protein